MNEIFFKCQLDEKDVMIISKGNYIMFELVRGESMITVCIDNKQAYTLLKCLESFINE